MKTLRNSSGFTLIELLIVIIIVSILGTLVGMTYSGIQAKNRNGQRQDDINTMKQELETYYAQFSKYPTLANLNDAAWREKNLKELQTGEVQDPRWSTGNKDCPAGTQITPEPKPNCYAYQVTSSDGSPCDNVATTCAQYTLTSLLEGGEKYVKSSLN